MSGFQSVCVRVHTSWARLRLSNRTVPTQPLFHHEMWEIETYHQIDMRELSEYATVHGS